MINRYLSDAYLNELRTGVEAVRTIRKKPAICCSENIFYPGGGGQPADHGTLCFDGDTAIPASRVLKQSDEVLVCLSEKLAVTAGQQVIARIDWERRYRFMRYHTGAHVLMGAIRQRVDNYEPLGIQISDDGAWCKVRFAGAWRQTAVEATAIVAQANEIVAQDRRVSAEEYASLAQAIVACGDLYRGPKTMKGGARIVRIAEWDANPCGGTHVRTLAEVGPLEVSNHGEDFITVSLRETQPTRGA